MSPMPSALSMSDAKYVAVRRSPLTPLVLSPSKNIRSPASEASDTRMSISYIDRHCTNVSSLLLLITTP